MVEERASKLMLHRPTLFCCFLDIDQETCRVGWNKEWSEAQNFFFKSVCGLSVLMMTCLVILE